MPDQTVAVNPPPSPPPTPTNAPASVSVQSVTPDGAAEAVTLKPGATTSEFILTMLIVVLGYITASGLITDNVTIRIVGIVSATLKAGLYTWSRTQVKTASMLVLFVLFAHTQTACATAASLDDKALTATVTSTKLAQATFEAYDDVHTSQITDHATNKADGNAQLAAWWAESAKIERLFVAVYAAISAWATTKDSPHLATVLSAGAALEAELHSAGVIK